MKTAFYLLLLVFIQTMLAQPPQAIKYQGVVRDNSGKPMINKNIALRINILKQSETGIPVYVEEHYTTTNPFGLFNINIGTGKKIQGRFDTIPWNAFNFYQKVEIDTLIWDMNDPNASNYEWMGTSQILSVPYSLASNISNSTLNNGYEKMWVFDTPGRYLFIVTGGEGNYLLEAWGGGGGGFSFECKVSFAGGGGAYAKSYFHLKNGDGFLVQVGSGGKKGVGSYSNPDEHGEGGTSYIDNQNGIFLSAGGGKGGFSMGAGGNAAGQLCINGQAGQYAGTDEGNEGGNAPNGGSGGYRGSDGTAPGGGGSTIQYWEITTGIPPDSICVRQLGNGANGRVVIHGQGNATIQPWPGGSN